MKYGMTDLQYQMLDQLVISPLKDMKIKVFLFGSRLTAHHHPHSDVDLLFEVPQNLILPAGFIAKIVEDIEESKFPFKVDLVNRSDLATSYKDKVFSQMLEL